MASSFSRLPLEILVMTLEYAPDLPSIYRFICASTSANTAFKLNSTRILDNAIERSIPEFKHLARMVAILGSSYPTFELLVNEYNKLPKDILTTAPASSIFRNDTPGSRYLVLTAYRIETLQHMCFVSLLQNAHEVIWSVDPTDTKESYFYPIKQSTNDVPFQTAAWWSPSWAEKTRITRALWKLMIYWNIQTICPSLTVMDDFMFCRYSERIQHISLCIGPDLTSDHYRDQLCHEQEEMKCVLAATRAFLDYPNDSFTPFTSQAIHKFRVKKWTSFTIFKETLSWKLEDPKPKEGSKAIYEGQNCGSVKRFNTSTREHYWHHWFRELHGYPTPKSDSYSPQTDCLGLCIWDYKRQRYLRLALALMYDKTLKPSLKSLKSLVSIS